MRWLLVWILLAAAIGTARAEERLGRVVIAFAADETPDPRLAAELSLLGFIVEPVAVRETEGEGVARQLLAVARARGALAAIRLLPVAAGTEVWVVDRVTGKTVLRELIAPSDVDAAALRTVELLRASLLELELDHAPFGEVPAPEQLVLRATPPPAAVVAPPPRQALPREALPREALPREAPPRGAPPIFTSPPRPSPWLRFGAEVALGAVGSPGGVGPTMHLLAAVTWRPLDIGGLRIFVAPALTTTTLNEPEGAASLRPGLLGGEVVLLPLGEEAPIGPSFAAGASATWLTVSGTEAADDLVTKATTTWGFSPHARAGLVVAPLPRLRLHLDGLAGVLARRVVVSFADRAAATWGRPILGATAGVEVVLR